MPFALAARCVEVIFAVLPRTQAFPTQEASSACLSGDGVEIRGGASLIVVHVELLERSDDARVELSAAESADLPERPLERPRLLVGTLVGV